MTRYKADGYGIYIVDPTAKPGDPDERQPVILVCCENIEETGPFATRIAASLNGSEAVLEALTELVTEIEGTPEHGIDADDSNCPVCFARQKARTAITTATGKQP